MLKSCPWCCLQFKSWLPYPWESRLETVGDPMSGQYENVYFSHSPAFSVPWFPTFLQLSLCALNHPFGKFHST